MTRAEEIEAEARRLCHRPHYGCIPAWAWRGAIRSIAASPETPEAAPALDVEAWMDAEHRWCVQVEGDHALHHNVEAHRRQAEFILARLSERGVKP